MNQPRHVVLIGLMGSGKSSIGEVVAERLGRSYLDNDDELERRTGRTARELVETEGAEALHREEATILRDAIGSETPAVIGAAASTVLDPELRDRLRAEFVVWLDADLDALAARLADSDDHRPFLDGDIRGVLQHQWDERAPLYREVASLVVGTDLDDDDRAIDRIVEAFGD